MRLDFWERLEDRDVTFGSTKLPLHQFYVTYKNPVIVQRIVDENLPVTISDWWQPINSESALCGQAKILLALGTGAQIDNLEIERGINRETVETGVFFRRPFESPKTFDAAVQSDMESKENSKSVQDVLEKFLERLQEQRSSNRHVETATNTETPLVEPQQPNLPSETLKLTECRLATNAQLQKTSDLLDYLNDALSTEPKVSPVSNETTFRARILIDSALHLPIRRSYKSRKTKKKTVEVPPCPYVTFETGIPGDVRMTPVLMKTASPRWNFKCEVCLPEELLSNNQKRLIFKVWSKSASAFAPNLQADSVLGFAALDLTVLASGLPSVQGWFNIVDFANKCNGQIKIDVTPLDQLKPTAPPQSHHSRLTESSPPKDDLESKESLSRALKRKFTELDEITQSLRTRLADVTRDDSDSDGLTDEFERDINTSVEDDSLLKTADFVPSADQQFLQGKQRIDALLEKLTLLSKAEGAVGRRYVSGCSLVNDGGNPAMEEMESIPSLTELSSSVSSGDCLDRCAPEGAGNSMSNESCTS